MKFLSISIFCLILLVKSNAQKVNTEVNIEKKVKDSIGTNFENEKVNIDSICNLLTAGTWQLNYMLKKGKRIEIHKNIVKLGPSKFIFKKNGELKTTSQGIKTTETWKLSKDGNYFTTNSGWNDLNNEKNWIIKLTSNILIIGVEGNKDNQIVFKLVK